MAETVMRSSLGFYKVEIMAEKPMPDRPAPTDPALSDDIERIVGYLNNKRSMASERANDLLNDISNRREELSKQAGSDGADEKRRQLGGASHTVADRELAERRTNPALSERYHSFCRDLDEMLESFRARINESKQVRH